MKAIARWLHPSSWHVLLIYLMMGVFGLLFAWFSFNLIHFLMGNFNLIAEHGFLALREGALRQATELIAAGYLAIAFYVAFKACEVEMVTRLRASAAVPEPEANVD
jgi:hypothetical protein